MPKTVMLVDDEALVVEIAKKKLEDRGYRVLVAGDGEEALALLKLDDKPDLIVTDIQMPKMTGYAFIMEMRKNPNFSTIPVVVISAYGEMEPILKRHAIKAYLLKPLKLQELMDKITGLLPL